MAQRMTGTTDRSRLTWRTLRAQADAFAGKLHGALTELAILDACRELKIDHICVRLKRISDVDSLKADLRAEGRVMSSVQVNGREITLVQLHRPLVVGGWEIFGVEAPYPKPRHDYDDGWEHVEFVLAGAENTLAGVRRAFCQRFPHLSIDALQASYGYSEDEPQAEGDQSPNPTLGLRVNGVGLKFHAKPIQAIVGYE